MQKKNEGLSDDVILSAVNKINPLSADCAVTGREFLFRRNGFDCFRITAADAQREYCLIEKIFFEESAELYRCGLCGNYPPTSPQIYHIDFENRILLTEELGGGYIQASRVENLSACTHLILNAAAGFHAFFWDNYDAFGQVGLDGRLESEESLLSYINAMENDFLIYIENEKAGNIPK